MLERLFGGIERDDTAGVDDHAVDFTTLPLAAPPLEIEMLRVKLVEVDLPPAIGVPVPRHGLRRCLGSRFGLGKAAEAYGQRDNCGHLEKIAARFQLVALL